MANKISRPKQTESNEGRATTNPTQGISVDPSATSDAVRFLRDRYVGDDPEQIASYEATLANAEVARDIHRLRTAAGLTQAQLAGLVGTTASVICRLEDSEYEGHSLSMLRRVAAAVGKRVEVRFVDAKKKRTKTEPV